MRFPNRFSAGGSDDYRVPPLLGGDSVAILSEDRVWHGRYRRNGEVEGDDDGRRNVKAQP